MDYRERIPLERGFGDELKSRLPVVLSVAERTRGTQGKIFKTGVVLTLVVCLAIAVGVFYVTPGWIEDWEEMRWFVAGTAVVIAVVMPFELRKGMHGNVSRAAGASLLRGVSAFVGDLRHMSQPTPQDDIDTLRQAGLLPPHDKILEGDVFQGRRGSVAFSLASCRLQRKRKGFVTRLVTVASGRVLTLIPDDSADPLPRLHIVTNGRVNRHELPVAFRPATPIKTGDLRIDTRYEIRPEVPLQAPLPETILTLLVFADRTAAAGGADIVGGVTDAARVTLLFDDAQPMFDLMDKADLRPDAGAQVNRVFRLIALATGAARILSGETEPTDGETVV